MKIFLDTADVESIKKWYKAGIIDGITTNPTHLSKTGGDVKNVIKEICTIVQHHDVSVEVTETEPEAVYEQAKKIAALSDNIVVKVPCHVNYYDVIKRLVEEDIAINVTLVFSLMQALCMCKLGVKYISPFVGRLDDIDADGIGLLREIRSMIDTYGYFETQMLAASLRSAHHVHEAIVVGVDVATIPVSVIDKITHHDLTDKGMKLFLDDWKKLGIKQFP